MGAFPSDNGAEKLVLIGARAGKIPPASFFTRERLEHAPQITVDGGIRFAPRPILWAGDGDSGTVPSGIPAVLKKHQDETDLRFCLSGIRPWSWTELHLIGFLGGRRDHELANLGEIHAEMTARPRSLKAVLYDDVLHPAVLFFPAGTHRAAIDGTFSVMTCVPAEITLSGDCLYPCDKIKLEPLAGRGVSNVGSGTVTVTGSHPFMILR